MLLCVRGIGAILLCVRHWCDDVVCEAFVRCCCV